MDRIIRRQTFGKARVSIFQMSALVLCIMLFAISTSMACQEHDQVKIMTRNLYIGADIFRVVEAATNPAAGPLDVPLSVAQVFDTIGYTNFSERAQAIADEIKKFKPHVVGLQEVSTILEQVPGDFVIGNPQSAKDVVFDYLSILMTAIEDRRLEYAVAVVTSNADVELPMIVGFNEAGVPLLNDVRLVDRDVILVRKGVKFSNALSGNYTTNVSLPLGGADIEFTRGYAAIDAEVEGRGFRFVNTHLEVGGGVDYVFSAVQAAQMYELLTLLAGTQQPVIIVGDLNSGPADVPINTSSYGFIIPPYMQATAGGYLDVADLARKPIGPTCCFNETLDDPDATLYERIDHILVAPRAGIEIEKAKVQTVGDSIRDMTCSGLWPSDHAGVIGVVGF